MAAERPKLTRAFIVRNPVYFQPETVTDAIEIQKKLFALGFEWVNTGVGVWEPETCVKKGIGVRDEKMWANKPEGCLFVSLTDFETFDIRSTLSPQQEYLLEL